MIDSTAYNATDCRDGAPGPRVWTEGCRGDFDFTRSFVRFLGAAVDGKVAGWFAL